MANTRYRRGKAYAEDMKRYVRCMAEDDNTQQCRQLRRNLSSALREDITERQRLALMLYYGEGLCMREVGERMGVDKSTVSRTIRRGEQRLRRCLRYGAGLLLDEAEERQFEERE